MNNAEVLIKFKADDTDVEKKTSNLSNKLSGLAKGLAIGSSRRNSSRSNYKSIDKWSNCNSTIRR